MVNTCKLTVLLGLTFTLCSLSALAQPRSPFPAFPPDSVTNILDRNQMMMWQLGVSLPDLPDEDQDPNRPAHTMPGKRPGQWTDAPGYLPQSPKGYLINRTPFGLWLNYTEKPEALGVYTPIDLLKANDDTPITTPELWNSKRRPELMKTCQEEIWGVIPPEAHQKNNIVWELETVSTADSAYGRFRECTILGKVDISFYPALKHQPEIKGRLYLPENARNVPLIIQYAWFRFPPHPTYLEECISRGWGFLQMDCTALQPDNSASLTDYLIGLYNKGNWRKPQDWGSLAAWSWGVSRLIDYFEETDIVDATRIGITGHSRYGKASLVTMAYEPRLAVAYISCSGAAGAAPLRRNNGQNIESVAVHSEYHWLAGNFMRWLGPLEKGGYMPRKVEKLTVDAHALLALCAPRPVFVAGGTNDSWCDSYGMYLTCRDASPAYTLLGVGGLTMEDRQPIPDKGYMDGNIAYRLHEGGHVDFLDWPAFANWAAPFLKKK